MLQDKEWLKFSRSLKDILGLQLSPVAISCVDKPLRENFDKKVRICKAILEAAEGDVLQVNRENNACFGAGWHMGFYKLKDPKTIHMIKKFVVEGEKLFSSYEALENLLSQMEEVPDNSNFYFLFSPLEKAEFKPQLVIFVCNAETASRLLTLIVFLDGNMPKLKIGGPTCRMSILYPILKSEVNISFYDYAARKICNVDKDKLLISIPYKKIPQIINSLDRCCAGRAKIEYPTEFKEFLKKIKNPTQGGKDGH
jgi:uncharacterized protein (DUF169 family)